jgi:PilZ domain
MSTVQKVTPPTPHRRASERRRSSRRNVTLGGRLFFGLAGLSLDCIIRDLSDHGARVAVPSAAWKAPKEIHLLSLREGRVYSGDVVWNRGRYLGLDFSEVRPVAEITDPMLAPIKAAWNAQAAKA